VRRIAAGIALALAALPVAGAAIVYGLSERVLERRHAVPGSARVAGKGSGDEAAAVDAALVERGRHLVTVVAQCSQCHGPDLAGGEMADDPWIGRLHAPNLTRGRGGVGGALTDAAWASALRGGVGRDGRSLLLMPSAELAWLSDRDLAAVVAYVRQVPPVDRVWPARRVGWLTRAVVAAGLAPDLISAEQVARRAPPRSPAGASPAADDGAYLVAVGSCRVCHRADLAGGLHPLSLPGEPVPPDLTPKGPIGRWTRHDFARAMREGRTPDGRVLDRAYMPWPGFAGLSEREIDAIWRYLASLAPMPGDAAGGDRQIARGTAAPSKG